MNLRERRWSIKLLACGASLGVRVSRPRVSPFEYLLLLSCNMTERFVILRCKSPKQPTNRNGLEYGNIYPCENYSVF